MGKGIRWAGIRVVVAGLVLLCLPGCLDLHQSFVVTDDGMGEFQFEVQLRSELLELDAAGEVDADKTCESEQWQERELPGELRQVSEAILDEGQLVCRYTISGPVADFEEFSANVGRETGNVDVISLTVLDDERIRIVSTYDFSDTSTEQSGGSASVARSVKKMIAANFEGSEVRWTVKAPTVLESNGEISADGRSVVWSLPLEQAIVDGGRYEFEVVIDYRNHRPRFF